MSGFVIDASVAAKWFLPEEHTDAALRFLDESLALSVPDLLFAEFGNLLLKRVNRGHLSERDARRIVKTLLAAPLEIEQSERHVELALDIAVKLGLTVYDSLYVAVAAARKDRLVTADRRLYEAVARSALAGHVLWVEHGPS